MHLLAVTPGRGFDPAAWARVLASGVDGFMVREKAMEARPLLEAVRWIQRTAPQVELWVNGRLDVALAAGCGLHTPEAHPPVPPELLPLSRPAHDETGLAGRLGCAQHLVSPVFETPGKGPAWGPARLLAALDALPAGPARILALGGVAPENAAALRHPRLQGAALIRALWDAPAPREIVSRLREAWAG
jgi:thiamine monophosphate synthase